MSICIRIFIVMLFASTLARGQSDPNPATLDDALMKLEIGIDQLEQRDPNAKNLILEAAADLEQVIADELLHTAGVYHALGNAYSLAGDNGRAVLAYRRGEQIAPTDARLISSLESARAQVAIEVQADTLHRAIELAMRWRGVIPRDAIWGTFLILFITPWVLFSTRVVSRVPSWFTPLSVWLLVASLIPSGLLAAEWVLNQGQDEVVVIQSGVIARSGPDDSIYDPVYAEPLDAGTEAVALEERDDWILLGLSDSSECWVRKESIERVNPN